MKITAYEVEGQEQDEVQNLPVKWGKIQCIYKWSKLGRFAACHKSAFKSQSFAPFVKKN